MRRLALTWPSSLPKAASRDRPLRLLAVSDETERSLELDVNRQALEPIDAVLGAGDLEPDYLSFLADAFRVPLLYIRGNHDRGGGWEEGHHLLPRALDGQWEKVGGITVRGMSWPSELDGRARRDDLAAWRQAIGLFRRARLPGPAPGIILSHVPPAGMGDTPTDHYHAGFAAYRWLCRSLRPTLWVHGHTTLAATTHWRETWHQTTLINVTGAALIEITPGPR